MPDHSQPNDHDLLVRIDERTRSLSELVPNLVTRKEFEPLKEKIPELATRKELDDAKIQSRKELDEVKLQLGETAKLKDLAPVKTITYGFVSTILVIVLTALIGSIID